jgi:hypothetical protein
MARKKVELNKAEEIRRYRKEHPDAKPVAVVEALAKRGVVVDTAYVSSIWHVEKQRERRHIRTVSTEALLECREFINEIGGEEAARELLGRLERLGGLVAAREAIDLIAKISR